MWGLRACRELHACERARVHAPEHAAVAFQLERRRGLTHRLVRHAPETISPLCWRMRRFGLTVNLAGVMVAGWLWVDWGETKVYQGVLANCVPTRPGDCLTDALTLCSCESAPLG